VRRDCEWMVGQAAEIILDIPKGRPHVEVESDQKKPYRQGP